MKLRPPKIFTLPKALRLRRQKAFSMVEIMIASAILTVVMAIFYSLSVGSARSLFDTRSKLEITRDVRNFTNELSRTGKSARQFYIYPSRTTTLAEGARVGGGDSGDFLLLVTIEPADWRDPSSDIHITQLVAYIREVADGTETGPVIRYRMDYPLDDTSRVFSADAAATTTTVEALAASMLGDVSVERREVLELSRGVANERLFINFRNRSVVVNGEILHGNQVRRITNTYNFTVTPRG